MMTMGVKLAAKPRTDFKKSATNKLRNEGFVPAVLYGKDKESKSIFINEIDLVKTVREEGRNAIISLDIENGDSFDVMLHDYQMHVLKDQVTHADFYVVDMDSEMEAQVPLRVLGEPKGLREGGVLQQPVYEITVLAKPREIPEEITVDVSELEIGDVVTIADLPTVAEYKFVDDVETTLATVTAPQAEEEETDVDPADLSVEPELVDAKDEDEEEEE